MYCTINNCHHKASAAISDSKDEYTNKINFYTDPQIKSDG